jgi:hypothetical protein
MKKTCLLFAAWFSCIATTNAAAPEYTPNNAARIFGICFLALLILTLNFLIFYVVAPWLAPKNALKFTRFIEGILPAIANTIQFKHYKAFSQKQAEKLLREEKAIEADNALRTAGV